MKKYSGLLIALLLFFALSFETALSQQQSCDSLKWSYTSVNPTPNDQGDCCYNFSLHSGLTYSNITNVIFTPLNQGVYVGSYTAPTSPSGWGTPSAYQNGVQFPTPNRQLSAGTHQFFKLCVYMPVGVSSFPMQITFTNAQGVPVCTDTVQLTCDICAGLHLYPLNVTPTPNDKGDCCYTIKLVADRSYSQIQYVEFIPIDAATTIGTALPPSSPTGWGSAQSMTPNGVRFRTPGASAPGLPAGTHDSFRLCFNLPAGVTSVPLIVKYTNADYMAICTDTLNLECQQPNNCDSLKIDFEKANPTPDDIGNCCYSFKLTTPVNFTNAIFVRFTSLNSAIPITMAVPPSSPSGWNLTAPAPPSSFVRFQAPGGFLHSGVHDSFKICFDVPANTAPFPVEIALIDDAGNSICTDTVSIVCQTGSECDSLTLGYDKVEPTPNDQGNCCWQFKINAAMDMTDILSVRFTSLDAAILIASAVPPANPSGWSVPSPTPPAQGVSFQAPGGYLHSGTHYYFRLCFDLPAGVNSIPVEVAYISPNGVTVCIDTVSLLCQSTGCNYKLGVEKMPPVVGTNINGDCCFKINMVAPNDITGVFYATFMPINPAITIGTALQPNIPPGWGAGISSGNGIMFPTPIIGGSSLVPAGENKYFRLCFNLPAGTTSFPVVIMLTDRDKKVLCADTVTFNCQKNDCDFEIRGEKIPQSNDFTAANLGDCCYIFKLLANMDFPGAFYLAFNPLNPGVNITIASTPSIPPGWGAAMPNPPNGVRYFTPGLTGGGVGLPAGIHEYFKMCFNLPPGVTTFPLQVAMTTRDGKGICYDTIFIKCGEGVGTCDSLKMQHSPYQPTPNDQLKGECCQQFTFTASSDFPNITGVSFQTPGIMIEGGQGPAGWSGPSPSLPSNIAVWHVPATQGHLTPGNYGPFKLCFDLSGGVSSFPIIITFLDENGDVICKFQDVINCKNCCQRFDTIGIKLEQIRQLPLLSGQFVWLKNSLTALPGPITRVSASIVSAQILTPTSTVSYHTFSDIILAKAFKPYWVISGSSVSCPLGGPGTSSTDGLQGVFGTFRTQPIYSRELLWGDYHFISSSVVLNNANMEMIIWFPPITSRLGDKLKFIVRYEFTDTNCCTCDRLVDYYLDRKFFSDNLTHGTANKTQKGDRVMADSTNNDIGIAMTDYYKGTMTVKNSSSGNDAITITGIALQPDYTIDSVFMHDNTSGYNSTFDASTGTAMLPVSIGAGAQTEITLYYDNVYEKKLFNNIVTLKFVYNDLPTDTLSVTTNVVAKVPGLGGGDQLSMDNSADLQHVYTYALNFANSNAYQELIDRVELKPQAGAEILAVGPTIDPQQIMLRAYNVSGGNNKLLPEIPASADVSSINPGENIQPIYISLRGTGTVNIDFVTYNTNGDTVTQGTLSVITSVIDVGGGGNNGDFVLYNCYPNPAGNNVTFNFFAKHDLNDVTLELTDVTGNVVAKILDNNSMLQGNHLVVFNTGSLPTGSYYYTLKAGASTQTQLLSIVK